MLSYIKRRSVKVIQIRATGIRFDFIKKFLIGVNRNSYFATGNRLPKNRDIVSYFHFTFVYGDCGRDKDIANLCGGAGSNAYGKSQKRRPIAFIIFGINAKNIIAAGKSADIEREISVRVRDGGCDNLRVFKECYGTFGIRPAVKNRTRNWCNISTTASAAATPTIAGGTRISSERRRTSSRT